MLKSCQQEKSITKLTLSISNIRKNMSNLRVRYESSISNLSLFFLKQQDPIIYTAIMAALARLGAQIRK